MPTTSKTFDTKLEAEKWAREIESEMDRGVFVSRSEAESTTLFDAIERYIEDYIPNLSHQRKNELMARAIQRRPIAMRIIASIRSKDIADFIKEREAEGVGGNTIRLDLALLSRVFEVAARDWGMESLVNPVRRVTKPKLPTGRERRLEPGEEDRLLNECHEVMQVIIRLALETAMRREEISRLEWKYVDLDFRTIKLPAANTKNRQARTIPLSPAALEILKSLPKDKNRLFDMTPDSITQAMGRACKRAGLENLHFHDLRHEATSRLFENTNLDVMEIRAITGHKDMQMLARYTHLRMDRLADRLAQAKNVD
jgi:integrase